MSALLVDTSIEADQGAYDHLYRSRPFLWPDRPGRMVKRAAEITIPNNAIDVGCGDGKDVRFLANLGARIHGIDICQAAVLSAHRRLGTQTPSENVLVERRDARCFLFDNASYDLAICYGLYHCLDNDELEAVHSGVARAIRPGGMLAFAMFNDELPIPSGHLTDRIFLRPRDHLDKWLRRWTKIAEEHGEIIEDHLPLVRLHRHSLTWGLYQKPA